MKSEWTDFAAVQAYCGTLSRHKLTHNLIVGEDSAKVVSARWATVDWSCLKSAISVRELISTSEIK